MQALPSSQGGLLGLGTGAGHPVCGTHEPTVLHWSAPGQVVIGFDPTHTWVLEHVSVCVHLFPSSQVAPLDLG